MASIFLSYSREDATKADRIALALEQAGHEVWWDRRIGAGSRFSKEIDAALTRADLVVVLWSRASVESAWVQDEAADGRDSGRLIPALLDAVSPPLGFRQYQSIDLTRRRGANAIQPLLDAVAAKYGAPAVAAARPTSHKQRFRLGWKLPTLAALAAMLVVALLLHLPRGGGGQTIAISAEGGDPQQSEEFVRSVALGLGQYRSGPLGRLTILREGEKGSSKADYVVSVGISLSGPTKAYVDLSLSTSGDPRKLWATALEGEPRRLADMRDQATAGLGNVLACLGEVQEQRAEIGREATGLYLNACGRAADVNTADPGEEAPNLFRQLTEQEPEFAPAWAWLSLLQTQSLFSTPGPELHQQVLAARANLKRAKAIDPTLAIVFAADANLPENSNPKTALAILAAGLKLHPDSAMLHSQRSYVLSTAGATNEAIREARAARELNPLSPTIRDTYISALAYAGRTAAAFKELAEAEATWPGSPVLADARYRLDLRYGDPRHALRLLREKGQGDLTGKSITAWELFLQARIDPTPAKIEAALGEFRARNSRSCCDFGYLQALGTFDRVDEAYRVMESDKAIDAFSGSTDAFFRTHMRSIYSDPRFMRVAQRLDLLAYWQQSGRWPDFCREPKLPYNCQKVAAQLSNPKEPKR